MGLHVRHLGRARAHGERPLRPGRAVAGAGDAGRRRRRAAGAGAGRPRRRPLGAARRVRRHGRGLLRVHRLPAGRLGLRGAADGHAAVRHHGQPGRRGDQHRGHRDRAPRRQAADEWLSRHVQPGRHGRRRPGQRRTRAGPGRAGPPAGGDRAGRRRRAGGQPRDAAGARQGGRGEAPAEPAARSPAAAGRAGVHGPHRRGRHVRLERAVHEAGARPASPAPRRWPTPASAARWPWAASAATGCAPACRAPS